MKARASAVTIGARPGRASQLGLALLLSIGGCQINCCLSEECDSGTTTSSESSGNDDHSEDSGYCLVANTRQLPLPLSCEGDTEVAGIAADKLRQVLNRRLDRSLGLDALHSPPFLPNISTQRIVDDLATPETEAPIEELRSPCDASEAIQRHIGGVAVLIPIAVVTQTTKHHAILKTAVIDRFDVGVCPSDTGRDQVELAETAGTAFFVDERHLLSAGHNMLSQVCQQRSALEPLATLDLDQRPLAIAIGVMSEHISADGSSIKIPRSRLIFGEDVEVVSCHPRSPSQIEQDWVLLRTKHAVTGIAPLPLRWGAPAKPKEIVHTLGYPSGLTMKYSLDSTVVKTGEQVFRLDLPTDNGSSGAPIFDTNGFVIGIHNGRKRRDCTVRCMYPDHGPRCCRMSRCSSSKCDGDGYATHIELVKQSLEQSRSAIAAQESSQP